VTATRTNRAIRGRPGNLCWHPRGWDSGGWGAPRISAAGAGSQQSRQRRPPGHAVSRPAACGVSGEHVDGGGSGLAQSSSSVLSAYSARADGSSTRYSGFAGICNANSKRSSGFATNASVCGKSTWSSNGRRPRVPRHQGSPRPARSGNVARRDRTRRRYAAES
jgi:hypothetical protein